jgi:hypothetical protein
LNFTSIISFCLRNSLKILQEKFQRLFQAKGFQDDVECFILLSLPRSGFWIGEELSSEL